jgi:hypothetical protein
MSSPSRRRSIAGLMPRQHHTLTLSFNHLHLNHHIPHTIILPIHTLHLRSVVHRVLMLLCHIRTLHLHLRSVIHQVLMLLHRIYIRHLHHMATHHIHILLPQLVVRRVSCSSTIFIPSTFDIFVPSASSCSLRR